MDCTSLAKHTTAATQSGRSISAQQAFTLTSCVQTVTSKIYRTYRHVETKCYQDGRFDTQYIVQGFFFSCPEFYFVSRPPRHLSYQVPNSDLYPTNPAREALLTPSFKQAAYMDHSNQGSSCKIPNSVVPRRALTRHRGEGTSLKHGLGCGSGPTRAYSSDVLTTSNGMTAYN
ncbi:hypothetical protein J1614_007605 [Plenodomus biglobosus]|nr:hypothetical protein J1614_007605 [Plenodomus biglobosus]